MIDQLMPVLIIVLVVAVIWILLKFVLRFTVKVFSCGCMVILAVGLLVVLFGWVDLPSLLR